MRAGRGHGLGRVVADGAGVAVGAQFAVGEGDGALQGPGAVTAGGDDGDEDRPALAAEPGGEFGGERDVEPAGGGAAAGAQPRVDGLGAVGPGGDPGQMAQDGLGGAHVAEGGARSLVHAEDDADDPVGGVVDDSATAEAGRGEFAGGERAQLHLAVPAAGGDQGGAVPAPAVVAVREAVHADGAVRGGEPVEPGGVRGGQRCREAQQGEIAAAVAEGILALGHVLVGADGRGHGGEAGDADQADGVVVAGADDMCGGEHACGVEQHARAEDAPVRRLDAGDPGRCA